MSNNFYAGASFNYTGSLQLSGPTQAGTSGVNGDQPDFSQWTVNASFYDPTGETQICILTVTNNSSDAIPATNGNFQLTATPTQTALWPAGKVQLVVQVVTDTGAVIYADPIWFRIKTIPMGPTIT
jgi:hypothetical protein